MGISTRQTKMKKNLIPILFLLFTVPAFSQDEETSLKKDIISADIGLLNVGINYERYLGGFFTLRSRLGLGFGFDFGQDFINGGTYHDYFFTPFVIAEPRYYYNFNRRVEKGKKTSYNASNYVALTATYFFKPFVISNAPYGEYQDEFSLIPKWGIKRTIGQRFNFEFALGAGLSFSKAETTVGYGLDLRFGYYLK